MDAKACRTCGERKPLMDFYKQNNGSLDRDCKPCRCEKVRANRLVKIDQYKEYERGRANLPHRIAARLAYQKTPSGKAAYDAGRKAYIARNPTKRVAHDAISNAIRDGRIVRQPCEVCSEPKAQAHHDDYSKPLDVRWLCTKHHAEWHKHNKPLCPPQDQEKAA